MTHSRRRPGRSRDAAARADKQPAVARARRRGAPPPPCDRVSSSRAPSAAHSAANANAQARRRRCDERVGVVRGSRVGAAMQTLSKANSTALKDAVPFYGGGSVSRRRVRCGAHGAWRSDYGYLSGRVRVLASRGARVLVRSQRVGGGVATDAAAPVLSDRSGCGVDVCDLRQRSLLSGLSRRPRLVAAALPRALGRQAQSRRRRRSPARACRVRSRSGRRDAGCESPHGAVGGFDPYAGGTDADETAKAINDAPVRARLALLVCALSTRRCSSAPTSAPFARRATRPCRRRTSSCSAPSSTPLAQRLPPCVASGVARGRR